METEVTWIMTGMSTLFDRDTVEGFKVSKRSRLESEQKSAADCAVSGTYAPYYFKVHSKKYEV
jgi:hypothetical protein